MDVRGLTQVSNLVLKKHFKYAVIISLMNDIHFNILKVSTVTFDSFNESLLNLLVS